ncbi:MULTISPECIES: ABC transporter substrate-binding protein [Marinomonas]|uniref:Iron-siderophore ABC transporter substrate-binding protein n=1 Tax=Marinomonas rhodophyticola TaxID=2992803 RepID=A0ABT3KJK7_9GAMM|nr:iron-siderophore ABC transporter substrate-binding protein [Marinomonas sp. KJ51-3]MCW4630695.1 iron-siderophore ABC transporter substrate-binding protein [Marinomonas sp. KJ51-3]
MMVKQVRKRVFLLIAFLLMLAPVNQVMASDSNTVHKSDAYKEIIHAMGSAEVPEKVLRVVTLFQGATDSVVALGVTPVGVVDSWAQPPTYEYLRDALKGVAHVGLETQPNLEAIVALKPDLIIGTKSRHEKIYGQLSQIAPTVMAENVYDFKTTLDLTAEALGKQEEGRQVWGAFQQRITHFHHVIKKRVPNWPLTAAVLNIRADHLRLYLNQSFSGVVLKEIGFKFPLPNENGWGVKLKTKEALPSVNADVFFIILQSDDAAVKQNYDAWRAHPLWKMLTAPKNQQVFEVDNVAWLLSGGILGAEKILDQLYQIYQLPQANH